MLKAFQNLKDNEDETIGTEYLGNLLANKGEMFSANELEEFKKLADPNNTGKIEYQQLVKVLLQ